MTLTSINEAFIMHRKVCKTCAGDDEKVCKAGLNLLLHFHQLIVYEVDREVAHEKAKAEVAEIQEARPGLRVLSRETLDRGLTRPELHSPAVRVRRRV
jgi:hypothetical protein